MWSSDRFISPRQWIVLVSILLTLAAPTARAEIVLVTAIDSTVSELSRDEAEQLYMGRRAAPCYCWICRPGPYVTSSTACLPARTQARSGPTGRAWSLPVARCRPPNLPTRAMPTASSWKTPTPSLTYRRVTPTIPSCGFSCASSNSPASLSAPAWHSESAGHNLEFRH